MTPPKPVKSRGLTPRQERFIEQYLIDPNAASAARRAGFSEASAPMYGINMLNKPHIRAIIDARQKERAERTGITADRVLLEGARLAFFDPRKLFNNDGTPKNIHELDDDTAACIVGIEIVEQYEGKGANRRFTGRVLKYKFSEKNAALEKLFKHHGLYEKDNRQKTDALAEVLARMTQSSVPVVKEDPTD